MKFAKKAFGLTRRAHSTKELRDKLYKRKYGKLDIDTVIAECERLVFLNDELFAANYAAELSGQSKGQLKMKIKLRDKGLSEDNIKKALEKISGNGEDNAKMDIKDKLRSLVHEYIAPI